ncbi:TIGR02450 family Trp-rich protein [Burkholderiaceae bacterium DAT-1]|nr:TIGR02450 family Trp-rich protein [Burkholderiaceae bacterium DAT-1]
MATRLNPKKLLRSKWTTRMPVNKEKHFLVTRIVQPDDPDAPITHVELEAIYSGRTRVIEWKSLLEETVWHQGWR